MKSFKFCVPLLMTLIFFSCKKDDNSADAKVSLLTKQSWKLTLQRWNPSGAGWYDSNPAACHMDNIITYYSNNTLINDEGPTTCNFGDPQTFATGTWSLHDNNTKLTIYQNGLPTEDLEILQLDDQTLKFLFRDTTNTNITVYEDTFSH